MGKKILFVLVIVLGIVGVTFTFSAAQTQSPEYKWRLQSTHAPADPSTTYLMPRLVAKLKEFSNGRIQLDYYPGGTLVPIPETLNNLGRGVYEMAFSVGAYWQGTIPVAGLEFGAPYAWYSPAEQMTVFHEKGIIDVLREAYATQGVRYLGAYSGEAFGLQTRVKCKNLNDLRKLKIRSIGVASLWLSKLKISTVQIAWPELYMALKLGTADGCTVGEYYWYDGKSVV